MGSVQQAQQGLAQLYQLYRQVLRVHRAKLPPPLRTLGDSYIRDELRRHLRGKTSQQQWIEFSQQWSAYVSMLSGRADADEAHGSVSPLHGVAEGELSAEQRKQLRRLKGAALELGGSGGADVGGGGGDGSRGPLQ